MLWGARRTWRSSWQLWSAEPTCCKLRSRSWGPPWSRRRGAGRSQSRSSWMPVSVSSSCTPRWHPHIKQILILWCCCFRLVTKPCPTLCDAMDCSLPGSSIHGIFQARVLEWVAIAFSDPLTTQSENAPFNVSHQKHINIQHCGAYSPFALHNIKHCWPARALNTLVILTTKNIHP